MSLTAGAITAIVFDLDGTLYVSAPLEEAIGRSAARYAGELLGTTADAGGQRLMEVRQRLTDERGTLQTLAVAIETIGGTVSELHRRFAAEIDPRPYLRPDPRVNNLLNGLGRRYTCWLLTNNNRTLTTKILAALAVPEVFHRVITINDTWRPKPDETVLDRLLEELSRPPDQVLFVGDRYDIDLRLPADRGCPVLLTRTVDELMALEALL